MAILLVSRGVNIIICNDNELEILKGCLDSVPTEQAKPNRDRDRLKRDLDNPEVV